MSNAIRQNEWREFLKAFWHEHKNALATLEVRELEATGGIVISGRRLNGLYVERSGEDILLEITVGDREGAQQVRTIRNPVSIRYIPKPVSACETMRIECPDGTYTILTAENEGNVPQDLIMSAKEAADRNSGFESARPRSAL
jgi:hypothetical protein